MIFSGWYGNGTWSLFRRLMKYKIQTVAAGKTPNDEMCKAIAAMFPPFVDETNGNQQAQDGVVAVGWNNQVFQFGTGSMSPDGLYQTCHTTFENA